MPDDKLSGKIKAKAEIKKRDPLFHSIRARVNTAVAICGVILMIFSLWLLSDSMNYVETDLMDDRLAADLRYLREGLGDDGTKQWHMENSTLFLGDLPLGDGTAARAADGELIRCGGISGTSFYLFIPASDGSGRFVLAACSVSGSSRPGLDGAPADEKAVAALTGNASDGSFSGLSEMNGMSVFCRYELIRDGESPAAILAAGRSMEEMESLIHKQKLRGFILITTAMVLISLSLGAIVFSMLGAIRQIRERLRLIGSGVFPEEPLKLKTRDELAEVADSVNEMVESLKEKERIGTELSLATDIQAHMLPSIFPAFPGHDEFDIYAAMDPAREVGGDFYDFFMLDDRNLAVVIADVSGKGVPAALFMVIAKTLIKNHTQMGLPPADVFTQVNQMLCDGNAAEMFVTAWMGVLDLESGRLTYVNAGHNAPLLRHNGGKYEFLRSRPGFVLAGMEGMSYRQNELFLKPGDRLFLYTDGVTEAADTGNGMYGNDRLESFLNAHADAAPRELIGLVRGDIDAFVGEAEQFDDITMLSLFYRERSAASAFIEREFEAADACLDEVIGFVTDELEKNGCPPKTVSQITLAVEEIFVNIAHYAYARTRQTMSLGICRDDGSVCLRFCDRGMPFDPLSNKDPDVSAAAEDRTVGGLGIYLVKKMMDDVSYRFENGQNVLTVRKKY